MQEHEATDQDTIKTMAICSAVFVVVAFITGFTCATVF